LSISEPSLRLFAHYLCLMCFNPGTTWNVDEDGTLYFVRAGESELLIPLAREDPRFKVEGPYIRWGFPGRLCARFSFNGFPSESLAQVRCENPRRSRSLHGYILEGVVGRRMPGRVSKRRAQRRARF
jgi:hypothetical protein